MDRLGEGSGSAGTKIIEDVIIFLKQNPDKKLEMFNLVKNLLNIEGTIKEKHKRIDLEKLIT